MLCDIYSGTLLRTINMQFNYLRKQRILSLKKNRSACSVVIAIIGAEGSGKTLFSTFLKSFLKVQKHHLECEKFHDIKTNTGISQQQYNDMLVNPFVSVFIYTCKRVSVTDISISMQSVFSWPKLQKCLGISESRLKAFHYNLNLTLHNSYKSGLSSSNIVSIIFNDLYSKRCVSDISRVADDLDMVCFLIEYQDSDDIIDFFINCRPHIKLSMRTYAEASTVDVNTQEESELKHKVIKYIF